MVTTASDTRQKPMTGEMDNTSLSVLTDDKRHYCARSYINKDYNDNMSSKPLTAKHHFDKTKTDIRPLLHRNTCTDPKDNCRDGQQRSLQVDVMVGVSAGEEHINPDSHALTSWRYHVVSSVEGLDAKRKLWVGRFNRS